jgi:LacI family transcriptional regulator
MPNALCHKKGEFVACCASRLPVSPNNLLLAIDFTDEIHYDRSAHVITIPDNRDGMPTIHDVARRAGVGSMTVSRVINNSGYISPKTRERVEKAIVELGYMPNTVARSLRSRRTNTVALMVTDITNPFFTTLARGVEDAANQAGYTVIFCNTDESQAKEEQYLQVLLQKQVDGLLIVPVQSQAKAIRQIQKHGTPVVVLDRWIPEAEVDTVRCNSLDGAYQLTRYLLSLGHTQIAILSGAVGTSTADDRVAGYRQALAEVKIEIDEQYIQRGEFTQESGYRMTKQAVNLPLRPTALIAANNFITIGAMKALQEMGLDVPEAIALAGFDDLPPALVTFPFFTVASQPAYEMGTQAMKLLLDRLEGEKSENFQEVILPIQIIIRRSSGDPIK